jgi:hypothetical protein
MRYESPESDISPEQGPDLETLPADSISELSGAFSERLRVYLSGPTLQELNQCLIDNQIKIPDLDKIDDDLATELASDLTEYPNMTEKDLNKVMAKIKSAVS